ncbi:hypothetical protein C8F01DRAFT_1084436 [Mycena amicta]|nr:hypothetical protein C8F01DRAFT_1084436 [Mycena amicta]
MATTLYRVLELYGTPLRTHMTTKKRRSATYTHHGKVIGRRYILPPTPSSLSQSSLAFVWSTEKGSCGKRGAQWWNSASVLRPRCIGEAAPCMDWQASQDIKPDATGSEKRVFMIMKTGLTDKRVSSEKRTRSYKRTRKTRASGGAKDGPGRKRMDTSPAQVGSRATSKTAGMVAQEENDDGHISRRIASKYGGLQTESISCSDAWSPYPAPLSPPRTPAESYWPACRRRGFAFALGTTREESRSTMEDVENADGEGYDSVFGLPWYARCRRRGSAFVNRKATELLGGAKDPVWKMDADADAVALRLRLAPRNGRLDEGGCPAASVKQWASNGMSEEEDLVSYERRRVHGKREAYGRCINRHYIHPNPQGDRERMRVLIHTRRERSQFVAIRGGSKSPSHRRHIVRHSFPSSQRAPYSNNPSSCSGEHVQQFSRPASPTTADAMDVFVFRGGAQPHDGLDDDQVNVGRGGLWNGAEAGGDTVVIEDSSYSRALPIRESRVESACTSERELVEGGHDDDDGVSWEGWKGIRDRTTVGGIEGRGMGVASSTKYQATLGLEGRLAALVENGAGSSVRLQRLKRPRRLRNGARGWHSDGRWSHECGQREWIHSSLAATGRLESRVERERQDAAAMTAGADAKHGLPRRYLKTVPARK